MTDYRTVQEELDRGTSPDALCATCPWDRLCITPPSISRHEIDRRVAEAEAKDAERPEGKMPVGSLLTTIMYAGRDTMASLCPVFVLRLQSPEGREVADQIRTWMRGGGPS